MKMNALFVVPKYLILCHQIMSHANPTFPLSPSAAADASDQQRQQTYLTDLARSLGGRAHSGVTHCNVLLPIDLGEVNEPLA